MTGFITVYKKDYILHKTPHGDKMYVPVVYWRTGRHICRRVFKRASEAAAYSKRFRQECEARSVKTVV